MKVKYGCLLVAVCLPIAVCTSCVRGTQGEGEGTTETTVTQNQFTSVPPGSSAAAPTTKESTTIQQSTSNQLRAATTTAPHSTEGTTTQQLSQTVPPATTVTQAAAKMPQTKAEIVQYYNEAANRVKREKPGFRWTETTYIGEIKLGNALMNSLVKPIVNLFDQEPRAQSPVPKGADHSLFPVKGQNYASKMEVSDVKDAQCVEKNGSYEITLRFKDEERDALPENPAEETRHGRFMNVTSAQENKVETAKFEKFLVFEEYKPNYRNCEIKCSIAIDSARLRSVTFRFCTDAEVRANAKGIAFGAQMRYTSTQKFILG